MDLQQLVLEQAALIEQLRTRITELEAEVVALRATNASLQATIVTPQKNSGNSSKPPSSDIVKPPKDTRPKGQGRSNGQKRKPGGQEGHKQNLRKPFDASQIDKTVELKLDACPTCGGKLKATNEPPKIHQQVELVEKPFVVTEFQQTWSWCEHCQCYHCADLPPEVEKSGLFGPQLIALTAWLKGRGHMSYTTMRDFFADAMSLKVSRGFLAKQVRKASNAMAKSYAELVTQLPSEPHLHIDETGHKENGKRRWTWCVRAKEFTVFHIDPSRGSVVLEQLLGPDYAGIISCDFWGAYRKFERLTSVVLQFCWAHLIREIKFFAESKDKKIANYGKRLLRYVRSMFSTIHDHGNISELAWKRRMNKHRRNILKTSQRSVPDNKDAKNIAERLSKWQDDYFRFIEHNIAPTNNPGEQTIRKVVIDRKVTQGTRSDWGNRWQERFWSILTTCEQQGRNVMTFLKSCVDAMIHGLAPPSLRHK
ncbi:MAG: IS66 family transposase [Planctomycetaceae bacterium]|nr:IS66 family transposase [Planctomycetaceae bacterium]